MYTMRIIAAVALCLAGAGCDAATNESRHQPSVPARADDAPVRTIATGLRTPWGLAFLPDGTALVTERGRDTRGEPVTPARILSVTPAGAVSEVQRLPTWHAVGDTGVRATGEAGLLGIAVSPTYATDKWVYVYYTNSYTVHKPDYDETHSEQRVARLHLGGPLETILTIVPAGEFHGGGRIAFGPDRMLYVPVGETFDTPAIAQDPASLGGKILRITPEGKPAPGNPFPGSPVYSLGHRNVQGLAWDSAGRLYASEFGYDRFDELNLIEPGHNYGWPVVEGPGTDPRFTNPIATWSPTSTASPSGIAIVGDHVYVACLAGKRLYRVSLDGRTNEPLFTGEYGRIRTVAVAPDGSLWFTTSNHDGRGQPGPDDDRILRLRAP